MATEDREAPRWTFLTNHARVFMLVAEQPDILIRELASRVGITERAVHRILKELEDSGYVSHQTVGRRNRYRVRKSLHFRHALHDDQQVGDLLDLLSSNTEGALEE